MSHDITALTKNLLHHGETAVWSGAPQPPRRYRLRRNLAIAAVIAVVVALGVFIWQVLRPTELSYVAQILAAVVMLALLPFVTRSIRTLWRGRDLVYALTDHRVLVLRINGDGSLKRSDALRYDRIVREEVSIRADGSGTIVFESSPLLTARRQECKRATEHSEALGALPRAAARPLTTALAGARRSSESYFVFRRIADCRAVYERYLKHKTR